MKKYRLLITNNDMFDFKNYYGYASPEKRIAYVRADLPPSVIKFVSAHEFYHLFDHAKNWIWREFKANFFAGLWHPIGLFRCITMTIFSKERIKCYLDRIKNKR
jgi:hypothetical protein